MKLCICGNYGPGNHVGGSENVMENVSIQLIKNFGYEITIFAFNYNSSCSYKGISLIPCQKGSKFISQISNFDQIFIYSDSFWEFDTLLQNIDKIDCKVSVGLVGGYHMTTHPESFRLLKENIDRFNLITHSLITPDYKWCIDNELPVKVIPNGVNTDEFKNNTINFREKYDIKEKYVILNVSSFFFAKGQEILPKIYKKLSEILDDFIILQLSNTIKYPYDKMFFNNCKNKCRGMNIRFMRDLPREDVVAAFKASDVFLSTSKKEVAPIVMLESKAAELPYVSMSVGNTREVKGGILILYDNVDEKGYAIVDSRVIAHYYVAIYHLLKRERIRNSIMKEIYDGVEKIDWKNIVPLYDKVFRNGK